MKNLRLKVAVITGAASGFGREFALLCARKGMKLVLADIDEAGLRETVKLLPPGTETAFMRCDVSRQDAVEQLATLTYSRFGECNLLFNNAGVAAAGPIWSATLEDWQWVLGVNLMGVVHGIRSFVPRMLEQRSKGHIVNTASAAGLVAVPGSSVYCVSKHAVVVMSECLYAELGKDRDHIGVSVLCPAFVNTKIAYSERNRPAALGKTNPLGAEYAEMAKQATQAAKLSAQDIAQMTMDAVRENRFYVITHPKIKPFVEMRLQDIVHGHQPRVDYHQKPKQGNRARRTRARQPVKSLSATRR